MKWEIKQRSLCASFTCLLFRRNSFWNKCCNKIVPSVYFIVSCTNISSLLGWWISVDPHRQTTFMGTRSGWSSNHDKWFEASDLNHLVTEPPCLCFCQRERAFTAILPMTCLGEHFKYRKYPYIMKEYSVSEKNLNGIDCNIFFK